MTRPVPNITRVPSRGAQTTSNVIGAVITLGMLFFATLALTTGSRIATQVVLWVAVVQSLIWLLMKVVKSK